MREKIWGARDLAPILGPQESAIGEAWYSYEKNAVSNGPLAGVTLGELVSDLGAELMGDSYRPSELTRRSADDPQNSEAASPTPYFPLLSKLIFTIDRLSVQVHPDDKYALAHEGGPGKTEMWYVVHAAPGASVALGLTKKLTPHQLRHAAHSGEIGNCLNWVLVHKHDTFLVAPGTLHSIGPDLVLCEIQQNSDLTYRFYDFGRLGTDGMPRPLHIDRAVAVTRQGSRPQPIPPLRFPDQIWNRELLVACPYFATERLRWSNSLTYRPDRARFHLLIFLEGDGRIGEYRYRKGDGYLVPAHAEPFLLQPASATAVIRSYVPDLASLRNELRQAGAGDEQLRSVLVE